MIPTSKSGPIAPKSWTSRTALVATAACLLGLTGCLFVHEASAGKRGKKPDPEPVVKPEPVVVESVPLFRGPLPFGAGPIPQGLPNLSAQGCAACHFDSHTTWAQGPHANGWRGVEFREAVAGAANPACNDCHLPLIEQRPLLYAIDNGVALASGHTHNPSFDARVRMEGVSCVVCQVREGKVTDEVVYLSAMEEQKNAVAQASAELDANGVFVDEMVSARQEGEFVMLPRDQITLMDVSPKQLVSVAAPHIQLLENDA